MDSLATQLSSARREVEARLNSQRENFETRTRLEKSYGLQENIVFRKVESQDVSSLLRDDVSDPNSTGASANNSQVEEEALAAVLEQLVAEDAEYEELLKLESALQAEKTQRLESAAAKARERLMESQQSSCFPGTECTEDALSFELHPEEAAQALERQRAEIDRLRAERSALESKSQQEASDSLPANSNREHNKNSSTPSNFAEMPAAKRLRNLSNLCQVTTKCSISSEDGRSTIHVGHSGNNTPTQFSFSLDENGRLAHEQQKTTGVTPGGGGTRAASSEFFNAM